MNKTLQQVGIWVDTQQAHIVRLTEKNAMMETLASGIEGHVREPGEGKPEGRFGECCGFAEDLAGVGAGMPESCQEAASVSSRWIVRGLVRVQRRSAPGWPLGVRSAGTDRPPPPKSRRPPF